MTAKFISTVLRAASVATVPLAMLVVSTPASAQRPGQRSPIERNVSQEVLAQMQRVRAVVIGVDPRESIGYGNSAAYQDWRYRNENYQDGHYKGKNKHYKNGHYKHKNKNYKNGYYRNGRGARDYDNDRDDNGRYNNDRYPNSRYPNGYPTRGAVRYPSSPVIPGFPTVNVPNGRAGKTLPGTNQQYPQNNTRPRKH